MKIYKALLLIALLVACHTYELFGQGVTCELPLDSARAAQFRAAPVFTFTPGSLDMPPSVYQTISAGKLAIQTGSIGLKYEKLQAVKEFTPGKYFGASSVHYFSSDSIVFFNEFPSTSENVIMVISPRYQKLSEKEKAMQLQVMEMFIDSEKKKLKSK